MDGGPDYPVKTAFPHRAPHRRAHNYYERRIIDLVDRVYLASLRPKVRAVYSLSVAFFQSPPYLQDGPNLDDKHTDDDTDKGSEE